MRIETSMPRLSALSRLERTGGDVRFGVCIRMLRYALANKVTINAFNGVDGAVTWSEDANGRNLGLRRWGLGRKVVGIKALFERGKLAMIWPCPKSLVPASSAGSTASSVWMADCSLRFQNWL